MSRRNRHFAILAALLLLIALPGLSRAGMWPNERDGWMVGMNLGGGTAGLNVPQINSDRESGAAGSFRVGYAFLNQLVVGLEGSGWTKTVEDETWRFGVGGASFTYFPLSRGFYVRGVVGGSRIKFKTPSGPTTVNADDSGFGLIGGAGYEFRLARKLAVGPQVDFSYAEIGDKISINYWNFTLGGNWYF